jgi:hypothetical protein
MKGLSKITPKIDPKCQYMSLNGPDMVPKVTNMVSKVRNMVPKVINIVSKVRNMSPKVTQISCRPLACIQRYLTTKLASDN